MRKFTIVLKGDIKITEWAETIEEARGKSEVRHPKSEIVEIRDHAIINNPFKGIVFNPS